MAKVLITGCSRGLGRALSVELAHRNFDVIATARNLSDVSDLEVYKKIRLDVTNSNDIENALKECGNIDLLVNNAGYSVAGPLEAIPIEEILKEFETNVIGPLRLSRAFIPGMRAAGKGMIVNISSVADRFTPPFGGSYSSVKAALAMMSEAFSFELSHFGIKVILIEAGAINTDFARKQKHFSAPEYNELSLQMDLRLKTYLEQNNRTDPADFAKAIADIIENPESKFRIPVGTDAEHIIELHEKLSDNEWRNTPLFKELNW